MTVTKILFKKTMSNFASTVAIVSSINQDGSFLGVTISSLTSLSLEPTMILFCLGKNSSKYQHLIENDLIAISILNKHQVHISQNFSRKINSSWENIDFFFGEQSKSPIIRDAIAFVECTIINRYEEGDHTIFTAKVLNCGELVESAPLLHFRSKYFSVSSLKD